MAQYARALSDVGAMYSNWYGQALSLLEPAAGGARSTPATSDHTNTGRGPGALRDTRARYPVVIDKPVVPDAYIDAIPVHPDPVTLSSGDRVVVPFRFWRTQALLLTGSIDLDYASALLARHDERPIPNVQRRATVHIYAPNYAGTSVGPIPAVFASIVVANNQFCGHGYREDGGCLDGEFFWQYRTSSHINHLFKREVWGIQSELAAINFDYLSPVKAVQLQEDGRISLTALWGGASRYRNYRPTPGELRFVSVTPYPKRTHYLTRFRGQQLDTGPSEAPFDPTTDHLYLGEDTSFGSALVAANFRPESWIYYGDYGGVVDLPPP